MKIASFVVVVASELALVEACTCFCKHLFTSIYNISNIYVYVYACLYFLLCKFNTTELSGLYGQIFLVEVWKIILFQITVL